MSRTGDQTVGGVTLTDIQSIYWSGTGFGSNDAWNFDFFGGDQYYFFKGNDFLSGWAVRSGDVVGVPEPGTVLLMAAGLGLLGFGRRERRR